MKITPLFYYPTITIWVDDDQTLLNVITYTFSDNFVIKPFQSPIECLEFIKSHVSPLSENKFLKEINDDETYGALQHSPTDFDITSIVKLLNDDSRKNEITTMVVDNYMSEMNGFELAKLCEFLPAKKILLTGGTNEIDAITGFNKKIIHRFVNKGDAQMEEKLRTYLHELSLDYFENISIPLLSHLEAERKTPLSDPVFIDFFEKFFINENVSEYYLIDKQGSFLCLDKQGNKFILIMHSDYSLDQWITSYAAELDEKVSKKITMREKIVFLGIGKEAWDFEPKNLEDYLYPINILDGRERYYWAKLDL